MPSQKRQNELCSFPRQTTEYQVIQADAPTSNAEEVDVEWFYEEFQDLFKLTPNSRGLECKCRKSRNTWNNRQIWPWSTEWSRANNIILPRERTGHSKELLPTTQEKTLHIGIIRWSTLKSDWLHSLQPKVKKLHRVCRNKTGSWLAQTMNFLLLNLDLIEESRKKH